MNTKLIDLALEEKAPAYFSETTLAAFNALVDDLRRALPTLPNNPQTEQEAQTLNSFITKLNTLRHSLIPNRREELTDLLAWRPPTLPAPPTQAEPPLETPNEPSLDHPLKPKPPGELSDEEQEELDRVRIALMRVVGPDAIHIRTGLKNEKERLLKKMNEPIFQAEPAKTLALQTISQPHGAPQLTPLDPASTPLDARTTAARPPHDPARVSFRAPTDRRADYSPLDDISPANQQIIVNLRKRGDTFASIAKKISAPIPTGLGIETTEWSVRRFIDRITRQETAQIAKANALDARDLALDLASQNHLIPATAHLFESKLFATVLKDELPVEQLNHITRNLLRLHQLSKSRNAGGGRGPLARVDPNNNTDVPRGTIDPLDNPSTPS